MWFSQRAASRSGLPAIAPILLLLVLPTSLSGFAFLTPNQPGALFMGTPHVTGTLTNGPSLGTHLQSPLYEVVLSDDETPTKALVQLGTYLNSTPLVVIRFGGDGAAYNPTTEINYEPPTSGSGQYVATHVELWNLTWFKSWCLSRTPHCVWTTYLPGEENNTQAAVHYARWFHQVLGFAPTYWEFGNEPSQWMSYGENMSKWSTTDTSQPSAIAYATMVHDYIQAVTAIYPHDKFIGLEAACACNSKLASETAEVDGSLLSGMAYHSYPSSSTSSTVLSGFYSLLSSAANITSTSLKFRDSANSLCSTCSHLPIGLGEYQAGPFSAFSPFSSAYPGAPFVAASLIEAIQANMSSFSIYDSNALYNTSSGATTYEGRLYSTILENMTLGADYGVTVQGSGVSGVYSLLIKNGTRESLLVVNTNSTLGLALSVPTSLFPVGTSGAEWLWSPSAPIPNHQSLTAIPSIYRIPAQGILLVDNF